MALPYKEGDRAFLNGLEVVVLRQVLFNRPAYRVRPVRQQSRAAYEQWVVDGSYLSNDPRKWVGLLALSKLR